MKPTDDRVETIFHAALEISDHAQREAFISAECREDLALEARIRRLIEVHEGAGGRLEGEPLSGSANGPRNGTGPSRASGCSTP
ncbi:MAG TPA: hypothetical protein VFD27_01665 [Chthoniobacteraceae bacterium]|jgi:hypothetical protein|nr:hypothetical protein [Chthoniobacteraceae bacterium]